MSSNRDKDGEKHTDRELNQGQLLDDNLGDEDDLNDNDDEDDEDIISDGLLTSLTDAAINNLSQLAALQERCESQQYSQQQQPQQAHQFPPQPQSSLDQSGSLPIQTQVHNSSLFTEDSESQSPEEHRETTDTGFNLHDPFSASNIANQAALAISATAAAMKGGSSSLILTHSPPNSNSQNSTIQADLSSRQSLTSVVAAAAAAVASNQQQQQHQYQHQIHGQGHDQITLAQQTRLISSALSSPEFYHNLQQYHQRQQQDQQQRSNLQQTAVQQQTSPISSLLFSPSTSIAPSPSSSSGQMRRSGSITSSGFLSPTTSPNYLRKQFMPDRLPLLSPSPSMIAGNSGLASTSLSHILQQQQQHHHSHQQQQEQQQQRSYVQQTGLPHQMSSISSLHFSPSTSITPSPSSLIGQSRRSGSSASFISPTTSPNYLRRQFMPDRLPLMSPSPSMTTGSSSAASTSLSHILQQHQHQHHRHHHQQRSASALAGSIISPSSTPVSSSGSTTVSSLISSKSASQARLNNMQIRHKFGYLGSGRGQFNSPHGFCLGKNQEIVVADTNNHRICIFDKSGTYLTQFGSPGKEEGQLWNPRKVAILHRPVTGGSTGNDLPHRHNPGQIVSTYSSHFTSGGGIQNTSSGVSNFASEPLYVVCDRGAERSRMQLFTKEGVFIKKIGIHYIDIVAGLAITQNGLIIVVDSVSPTVYIINAETGTLNGWFDCSGHMKEPSDIAVKSDIPGNEYFICDFKGHCVVVFSEQGEYLRKIGHDGLTSYPNGIDISDDGDILVGDSHGNRFHVVVFDRNGNFVSQFECPHVKVSRCCGLKITREGYIVTLAKNNHHVLVLDTIHI